MQDHRTEYDLLGKIQVPREALYGAQTQRAIKNFPINNQKTIGNYPKLISALMKIKEAAATANGHIGIIGDKKVRAICAASEKVLHDRLFDQFPIHPLHGGGGTSANMNVNEVLANIANEYLGGNRGQYDQVHPNDHVNLNQSTNDVYPTACHLAIIDQWKDLKLAFTNIDKVFTELIQKAGANCRLARTCLQDAVEITFGDLFGGYKSVIERTCKRVDLAVDQLEFVNLGGTIVGRNCDVSKEYATYVIQELNKRIPFAVIKRSNNLFDSAQNIDDLVAVSALLDLAARTFIKICKDLRLMNSGPEGGLNEIRLPSVQPGSSIMPGKVNPVIPEFLIQICFRVMGNHHMCSAALDHGELDLNVWESPVVFGILDSMELMQTGLNVFAEKCIYAIEINSECNIAHSQTIIPKLTKLAHEHGYSVINSICKRSGDDIDLLKRLLKEHGYDN